MNVGICRLTLHLPGNRSLKGKRQIIKPLMERLGRRFGVAVAEVGGQDHWKAATIGIAAVSGDARHASEVIDRVVKYAEGQLFEAQIVNVETDVIYLD